jgi:hypothetical protein
MDSSALLSSDEKYCHNGGMGSPPELARRRGEDRASPTPTPTSVNRLIRRINAPRVWESSSFGGEDQLVCLGLVCLSSGEKYCRKRA